MSETVKLKINGVEHELPKGLSILQAAKKIGVHIPYFCWHKHLSVSGNCRMCLVEVKPGPPKPSIACGTPIAEGMEVFTETDSIRAARKSVLEFLLLNHPLDCPVCDEAYECKLQDYTFKYGATTSRFTPFHEQKRVFIRQNLGKLFVEMNRCIHCTRCVRFLREVAGEYELERTHRGHELKIHTYKKAFESDFAINAADLCPVGALEDRKFRFSARNWDLVRTPSICPSCSIGCNIFIDVYDNQIKRLLPRENNAVNATWICDAGRHNVGFVNKNRLNSAYLRQGGELVPTALPEVIDRTANEVARIRERHGAEALAMLLSPWMTNEELFLGKKLASLMGLQRMGALLGYNHRPIVPVMSDILPKTLVSDDKTPNSTGARLLNLREGDEDFTFGHELLAAIEDGRVKGLILFHEDLAQRPGFDPAVVDATLARLEFLLVVAWSPTVAGAHAHAMLPAPTFAEKHGTFTNHGKRVQRLRKALSAPADVPSELQLLTMLGRAFDPGFGFDKARTAFEAMVREEAAFAGLDWEQISKLSELGLSES